MDDGPIAIYQSSGFPQHGGSGGTASLGAIALVAGFVACAGGAAIFMLGDFRSAGQDAASPVVVADGPASAAPVAVETAAAGADAPAGEVTAALSDGEAGGERAGEPEPRLSSLSVDDPRWFDTQRHAGPKAAAAVTALAREASPQAVATGDGELLAFAQRPEKPRVEPDAVAPAPAPVEPAVIPRVRDESPPAALPEARKTVRVNSAVNMRSRPQKGAAVIGVIPGNASVGLVGCDLWCHVVYEGRSGYIFKDFVQERTRIAAEPVSARATAAPVAADDAAPAEVLAPADGGVTISDSVRAANRGR